MKKKISNTEDFFHIDWLFGGNPKAIETQEARGQQELVESSQLPAKHNSNNDVETLIKQYELLGIKVIGKSKNDELFLDVIIPNGWKLEETEHSMWTKLLDDNGSERASIFYKAAFYDRDAFINFKSRYQVEGDYSIKNQMAYKVVDNKTNETLFQTNYATRNTDGNNSEYFRLTDQFEKVAKTYINSNYPNHKDFNAYW